MGSNSIDWKRYLDLNEAARYADSHYHEIQYTIYAVGATGLILLTRSLRLFSKFTTVRKIPDSYFRKQVKLHGFVRSIEGGEKATLNVEHIPIVELNYHKRVKGLLPVRLAGLSPWSEPASSKFVANQVLNKRVTFQLIEEGPKEEFLLAAVYHRPYWFWRSRSLNADVVEQGLASYIFDGVTALSTVDASADQKAVKKFLPQPVEHRLAERLMQAQKTAQRKRVGIWADVVPATETGSRDGTALVPVAKRGSSLPTKISAVTAPITRAVRYGVSAVVFFPASVKDKILQKRSIS